MLLKHNPNESVVLVVDDQAEARRLIARYLASENCRILEAINGQEGVRLFVEHQPDLIILDAIMPTLDGFEACRQIKAMPIANSTPILMITSLADRDSIQKAFAAGATDYLNKPISSTILRHRVRHFLHSRQIERHILRQNFTLEQINRAANAATSSLDSQETLYQIIHVAAQALDVTSAHVLAYDRQNKRVSPLANYFAPMIQHQQGCTHDSPFSILDVPHLHDWLISPPPPVYQFRVKDLPATEHDYFCGAQSVLYVPFYVNGQLCGYLSFWENREERVFNADEIALVQSINSQIASSLHLAQLHTSLKSSESNARRYAHELESRNRELDAYTYTIAHDLKSPLQTLLSYISFVEDLDKERVSEQGLTYLHKSQQQIIAMSNMIDQLLMLANLRDAQEAITPLALNPLIETVLERHRADLDQRGFEVVVAADLPKVLGNDAWVQEVFANLISNAVKYIGETNTQPQLHIYAKVLQGQIRLNVQDNGVGIAPEDHRHIYQRFTRLQHPKTRGFGIGLAIVEQLIHKMNGQVGVESALGMGSIFWFTLPKAE